MTTRFVLVSDTHNHTPELPPGDILLHAGDFTMEGSRREMEAAMEWLGWNAKHRFREVVITGGNHDWFLYHLSQEMGTPAVRAFVRQFGKNILYLENEYGTVFANDGGEVAIYGSPVQPNYGGWAWNQARGAEIKATWERIPTGMDILMTHGPAHGILDWWGKERIGCEDLREALDRAQPKMHVFGHVHAAYGRGRAYTQGMEHSVESYNAAYSGAPTADGKNYLIDPKHKPWVVDYDGKKFVEAK